MKYFVKTITTATLITVLAACQSSPSLKTKPLIKNANKHTDYFLVGGYGMSAQTGIYLVSFNKNSLQLQKEKMLAQALNPAYLAWQPQQESKKSLYSIATTADKSPLLNKFNWNFNEQQFDLVQSVNIGGRGICHININHQKNLVATANYTSGDISVFDISNNEVNKSATFKNTGKGLTSRQEAPHLHYVGWGNENRFLYSADLGTDEILVFDSEQKKLSPIQRVKLQPGDGPRHLEFHPTQNVIYSLNELSNSVSVFQQNNDSGKLMLIDRFLLKPTQSEGINNIASAIRIDKSGQHLYVAVRGENILYGLKVSSYGKLSLINKVNTGGDHPRDFNFSPEQDYLLVANQDSNQLNVIYRDSVSGRLRLSTAKLAIKNPSFIQAFNE